MQMSLAFLASASQAFLSPLAAIALPQSSKAPAQSAAATEESLGWFMDVPCVERREYRRPGRRSGSEGAARDGGAFPTARLAAAKKKAGASTGLFLRPGCPGGISSDGC